MLRASQCVQRRNDPCRFVSALRGNGQSKNRGRGVGRVFPPWRVFGGVRSGREFGSEWPTRKVFTRPEAKSPQSAMNPKLYWRKVESRSTLGSNDRGMAPGAVIIENLC